MCSCRLKCTDQTANIFKIIFEWLRISFSRNQPVSCNRYIFGIEFSIFKWEQLGIEEKKAINSMSVLTFGLFWFLQFTRTLNSKFSCEKWKDGAWHLNTAFRNCHISFECDSISDVIRNICRLRHEMELLANTLPEILFENWINVSAKKKDSWIFLTSFAFFESRKNQSALMWTRAIDVDQFVEFCQIWIVRQFRRIKKRQIKMCYSDIGELSTRNNSHSAHNTALQIRRRRRRRRSEERIKGVFKSHLFLML